MKRIVLTQGQIALVDDEDFEKLNKYKWYAIKGRETFYAQRMSPTINGRRHIIKMHHEIIGKPLKGFVTDHRNGRGLDDQRHNLRHVTRRQNSQNRKNGHKESSKFPGVSWSKRKKVWQAKIYVNGRQKHLGHFVDEYEAFKIYRQAVNAIGEEIIGGLECLYVLGKVRRL